MRKYNPANFFIRLRRVLLIGALAECYEYYTEMMMHSRLAAIKTNYETASNFADMIERIFQMDTNIKDFMPDENEESEKALRFYDRWKESLESPYIDAKAAKAFCKAMRHYDGYTWLNGEGYIYMHKYLDDMSMYLMGKIDRWELQRRFVYYKIWDRGKPVKGNFSLVRKTFRQMEDLYMEILSKQDKRERKKNEQNIRRDR